MLLSSLLSDVGIWRLPNTSVNVVRRCLARPSALLILTMRRPKVPSRSFQRGLLIMFLVRLVRRRAIWILRILLPCRLQSGRLDGSVLVDVFLEIERKEDDEVDFVCCSIPQHVSKLV
jgi:hypothetical protein